MKNILPQSFSTQLPRATMLLSIIGFCMLLVSTVSAAPFAELAKKSHAKEAIARSLKIEKTVRKSRIDAIPTDIYLTNTNVDENNPIEHLIGTLSAEDADEGDTHVYSLLINPGSNFYITNGNELRTIVSFDFEDTESYLIRINVDDQNGGTFFKNFTINVNDLNDEAPVNVFLSNDDIDENNDVNDVVGILSTADADAGEPHVYTLVVNPDNKFNISGNELRANESFDFETNENFYVEVESDDQSVGTWTKGFVINVNDLAEIDPPTDIVLSKDNIDEHCPTGTLIGNFSAVDVDGGVYSWSLVAGAGASGNMSFDIPFGSSALYSDEIFNYESQTSFSIQVEVEDENHNTFSKAFTININDIDEANLTSTVVLSSTSIGETNEIGDVVGTLVTNGVHAGTNHTYSLASGSGSTNNASFSISGNELLAAEVFDEDVKSSYSIRIRSDSQEGESVFKVQTITIDRVNNEPTDITLTDNSFEENRSVGYRVGFLNTTDLDDDGETYTYSFVEGPGDDDNASFEILSSQFRLATTFDYETQTTHSVRIRTEDGNGGSFERALTILVENSLFEPITDIFLSPSDIDEDNEVADVIGTLTSEDDDAGDVHTYTLRTIDGSTDHTAFSISDDALTAAETFDFETKSSYTIRVRSSDGTGFFLDKDFVVTINDTVEPIEWNGSWVGGLVPTDEDNVVINANFFVRNNGEFGANNLKVNTGFTLTVNGGNRLTVDGNIINNGSIEVESGSSLVTYEGNSFTGNDIEIRRNTRFDDGRYSFVGSPVEQNAGVTDVTIGDNVYYYDETESFTNMDGLDRWDEMVGELVPGRGYTQANQEEIIFTGIPNTGTIVHAGTYTEDALDENEGWNLVANPYAAGINVTDFLAANTNTSGAIYIWDDNGSNSQRGTNADYIVANGTMANSTQMDEDVDRYNDHVGSSQGFFVKLNSAANTDITFTETMRRIYKSADENFFREEALPIARVNLTDSQGLFKQAVIGFAEDANENGLNKTYDAQAFNATSDYGLFTMKAGRSLTLNGMTSGWEIIQLQVNTAEAGVYQISAELGEYSQHIYLRDLLTEEVIDLKNGGYSFSAQAGINTDRFELISSPSNVLGLESEKAFIYTSNKILHIEKQTKEAKEFQLFNMNGKLLLSTSVESKKEVNLNAYPSGIYLVFDGQKTHKIILK